MTPSNPLPAREINLKACTPEIQTRNLPADPGIEPRLLRQTVPVGAHCVLVTGTTEAGHSSTYHCEIISILFEVLHSFIRTANISNTVRSTERSDLARINPRQPSFTAMYNVLLLVK